MQNQLENPGFWCRLFLKFLSRVGRTSKHCKSFVRIQSVWHVLRIAHYYFRAGFIHLFIHVNFGPCIRSFMGWLYIYKVNYRWYPCSASFLLIHHTDEIHPTSRDFLKFPVPTAAVPVFLYWYRISFFNDRKSSHIKPFFAGCHLSPTSSLPYIQDGCC